MFRLSKVAPIRPYIKGTKKVIFTTAIYTVEISTRCSFVIEFIIPKFIEGSTCFERHTAYHQEL